MKKTFVFIFLTFLIHQTLGQNKILFESASNLAKEIREGKISSYEVVLAYVEQIEQQNANYNAIVLLEKEQALKRAKEADLAIANHQIWGKLHGVPITIKDNFKTKGIKTTAGYLPLENNIPDEDAEIVKLLLAEGAIIIGKTNLSTLAMDMQTSNSIFGTTNNPWDTSRTSGGSSGGCATALATGMTPLTFGNDLAGSIRIPAAYCGVYGFKPTFGTVSLGGIQTDPKEKTNGLKSLAVAGPLARNIDDLELALQIITQPTTTDQKLVPLNSSRDDLNIKNLKIAWTDEFGGVPVDNVIKDAIKKYVEKLEKEGAFVVKAVPAINFYQAWETWGSIVATQGGYNTSNFIKWLGLPFTKGALKEVPMHQNIVKPTSVEKYMKALNIQDSLITRMENFLNEYDVFICPVSTVMAFKHHAPSRQYGSFRIYNEPLTVNKNEIHYYMATQAYTIPFTLTESPVLTMPLGLSKECLPIGVQLIGKRYEDFKLIEIGKIVDTYSEKFEFPLEE
ncbi:conserved hypothetical protein [Flavobacterium sp. 9AF]|uniref:amidase n=1 Tax=Flavobacterium sp. 9AF TaxID=2653142 RepID=UPI0012F1FEF9|nr:amidase [Flavobacterium sp. 9AF]VXB49787.1 conserved hypothetical protein [Flavobacterium sp. 9AF]